MSKICPETRFFCGDCLVKLTASLIKTGSFSAFFLQKTSIFLGIKDFFETVLMIVFWKQLESF